MLKPKPNQEIKVDKTKRQEEIENQLKITLKPPTPLHHREPLPTPTTVEPNQNQPSECLETQTTDNTTKPKDDKPVNTLQQLMNKAMPETKTKPLKTPRQPKKPKPKVVEPSELRLFLEKKKREREMKTKGKSVVSVKTVTVENFEPDPSQPQYVGLPRNESDSATINFLKSSCVLRVLRRDVQSATTSNASLGGGGLSTTKGEWRHRVTHRQEANGRTLNGV